MRLKSTLIVSQVLPAIFALVILAMVVAIQDTNDAISIAESRRSESLILADQLRHSSDDLSRMARAYAATGEKIYLDSFERIRAIRSGEIPRPKGYYQIYWDFVLAKDYPAEDEPAGAAASVLELFEEQGISDHERSLLFQAYEQSELLVNLEHAAFEESRKGVEGRMKAIAMLNSDGYLKAKVKIMRPISAFFRSVDQRTKGEVDRLAVREKFLISATIYTITAIIGIVMAFLIWATRRVVHPIEILREKVNSIAKGDFGQKTRFNSPQEVLTLGMAFNQMSESIERQILDREQENMDLEASKASAEELSQAKARFLSSMSHELRTPLTSVMGYTRILMSSGRLEAGQKGALEAILRSGERMLSLIDETLELATIEARAYQVNPREFSVKDLIREITETFHPTASQRRLKFEREASDELPEMLRGDYDKILQVLINIVGNAFKYTERGSICLRVYPVDRFPMGTVAPSTRVIRFEVEDSGRGFKEKDIPKVFAPFSRFHDAKTRADSHGLGLSISKALVSSMGGDISVQSVFGQGAKFIIDLPLEVAPTPSS